MKNSEDSRSQGRTPESGASKRETLLAQILSRTRSGEDVEPEEYLEKYPELEFEIKELFDKLDKYATEELAKLPEGAADRPKAVDGRILGDFKIVREIGRGGMAAVYEAEQLSVNRRVALKLLPAHLGISSEAVLKFRREAEAGGRQSHPGIVAIYALGEQDGQHFIAQELVADGRTLAHYIEELSSVENVPIGYFREAVEFVAAAAEALQHAHDSGVIHRDVKPSNILLTRENHPKLTDFGLAKVENALALSQTGVLAGTPYYMSPEQIMRRRTGIDHRTDIYSLGVTFFEMLTLQVPFGGDTSHEVLKKIIQKEPQDPRTINRRVPRDLAVICLKAMEKDPSRRYQTMSALADDLRRFLQGEVIEARPASVALRLVRQVKRNPAVSAAVGIASLAVLSTFCYILFVSYPQVVRERDRAEKEAAKAGAALEFLEGMFESPDPRFEGRDVKVVDVLARGSREVEKVFGGQPEAEALIHSIIGTTYRELGFYEESLTHLERALAVRRDCFNGDHPDPFRSANNLGLLCTEMGRLDEAEILLVEAREGLERLLGGDAPQTLTAKDNLAGLRMTQGRLEESESLFRKVHGARGRLLGEDHEDTLATMNNLANVLNLRDKKDESEAFYRRCLEGCRRTKGKDDYFTLSCQANFAALLFDRGKFAEAEALLRLVIDHNSAQIGRDHPRILASMGNLASLLLAQDRLEEAESLLKEILDVRKKTLDKNHPDTLKTMNGLASVVFRQGMTKRSWDKIVEAKELFEELNDLWILKFGDDHPQTLRLMSNLALVYRSLSQDDEAEQMYRRVVDQSRTILGAEHMDTLESTSDLAMLLLERRRPEEALGLMESIVETAARCVPASHPNRGLFLSCHGKCLLLLQRFSEAEPQLLSAYAILEKALGTESRHTQTALKMIVALYEQWGRAAKAQEYRKLISS